MKLLSLPRRAREADIEFCDRCSCVCSPATRTMAARESVEAAVLRLRYGYHA